jgi:formylglycine-generating enzyme required for sulfatase activity
LQFSLWDFPTGPSLLASALTNIAVPVSEGLFTVTLDFGANFSGNNRWLEIAVRTNGSGAFSTLSPRQQITAAPYAITAGMLHDKTTPTMVLVPAGTFTMGNSIGDSDITDAGPVSVTLSAFYMDANLVSLNQWKSVYFWATNTGYGFAHTGSGAGGTGPVQTIDWYDAAKWCNARSQMEGRTPVYYTDGGFLAAYTNGEVTVYANWAAKGYRLPTEAEWEIASRGGLSGKRFPWGNQISQSLANYYGYPALYSYDLGPTGHSSGVAGTTPAATYPANAYNLYDMAGNVYQWCWDWYPSPFAPYAGGTNPHGPASGTQRIVRSGFYDNQANNTRCAARTSVIPTTANSAFGFRTVLPAGP